jgi:hypothetical protein
MDLSLASAKRNLYGMNFHVDDVRVVRELGNVDKKSNLHLIELIILIRK